MTDPSIEREIRDAEQILQAYLLSLSSGICPECKGKIESRYKQNSCVYARPCNHRLYNSSEGEEEEVAES